MESNMPFSKYGNIMTTSQKVGQSGLMRVSPPFHVVLIIAFRKNAQLFEALFYI